ncbi:hypothetical protein RDI58_022294 [Solanum bulbocastanum]|uniref:DUF4283 domain-containing protein n=1 Tax=Solanum bulbocastanum TaxID=147425 RepID=A0AAN8T1T0_SOLBU
MEASKEEQQDKGKGAIWRVKDTINNKETTTHRNIEKEKRQPETNSKENTGKYARTSLNDYDQTNTLGNNSHNSQNKCEKGISIVQADVNEAKGHVEKTSHSTLNVDNQILPHVKISSNFYVNRPGQQRMTQSSPKQNQNKPPATSSFTRNISQQIPDPSPFTVTQSLATRLRAIQLKNDTPMDIISPIITTRQGYPSITFHEEDFMQKMPDRCKFTLVGKFTNAMPKMEIIRKSFIAQTQLTGGVKIAHFNSRHIYIDLDNKADHISMWTK